MDRPTAFNADTRIATTGDLLDVLDELLESKDDAWWDAFFADRTRAVPFFVDCPDESLVDDFWREVLRPGRVLELGCGNGRNAIYLASRDCSVDAIDFSQAAIVWAKDRARDARRRINFIHGSMFEVDIASATYDIAYDSGCFHHIPPHRREAYVNVVSTALKPGVILSMICFRPEGGSGLTDLQVYEQRTLGGGLGFTEESLHRIFNASFEIVTIRQMREVLPTDDVYGKDFLSVVRMRKR